MLVTLHQYKHEEVQFDDNRTAGESQTEDSVDRDPEAYFGENPDLDAATWETIEHEDAPIQRREVTFDGVTAVSVSDDSDDSLPGRTVQIRREGSIEQFEHSELVEAEDRTPS
jgi:hypothetical protein